MIIGIAGYKGSGKDSLGEILTNTFGWKKMSFAQPIKDLAHNTFGIDKAILSGTDGEREFRELPLPDWFNLSSRDMLQKVGMAFRENLHKDIWVRILENQYKVCKEHVVITARPFGPPLTYPRARRGPTGEEEEEAPRANTSPLTPALRVSAHSP